MTGSGTVNKKIKKYCGIYDAYYDIDNRLWIDKQCNNPECIFCNDRPEIHQNNCECFSKDNNKLYLINGLIENHG
ncbi:MAG: hypothetical protein ACFFG0_08085 [Candidatus Thorarchaeota archaeon]